MNGRQPAVAAPVGAQATARRYYVVAHDIAPVGYDMLEVAINVACQYGDDTDIVDTLAIPYHPMVQRIDRERRSDLPRVWRMGTRKHRADGAAEGAFF
jgi:hypothetical protein